MNVFNAIPVVGWLIAACICFIISIPITLYLLLLATACVPGHSVLAHGLPDLAALVVARALHAEHHVELKLKL